MEQNTALNRLTELVRRRGNSDDVVALAVVTAALNTKPDVKMVINDDPLGPDHDCDRVPASPRPNT